MVIIAIAAVGPCVAKWRSMFRCSRHQNAATFVSSFSDPWTSFSFCFSPTYCWLLCRIRMCRAPGKSTTLSPLSSPFSHHLFPLVSDRRLPSLWGERLRLPDKNPSLAPQKAEQTPDTHETRASHIIIFVR